MCNLYSPTHKDDVERVIRKQLRVGAALPDYPPNPVGPFGTGLFLRPDGDGLRGDLGQWGLIRPNQAERIDYIKPKATPGRKPPAPIRKQASSSRTSP